MIVRRKSPTSLQFYNAPRHGQRDGTSLPRQTDLLQAHCGGGPEPESRGLLVRKGNPSTAIFGAPSQPLPPQDAYDPQRSSAGNSQDNAILIFGDGESDDDLDDGRSDASFPPLEGLLAAAHNKVKSGSC